MNSTRLFLALCSVFLSCTDAGRYTETPEAGSTEAKYVLPFPVGSSYRCLQGFHGPYSHYGVFSHSVDFYMPIGTIITAGRGGQVLYIQDGYLDTDKTPGHENVVVIAHGDSTYARYVHLTTGGALVGVGQVVVPGDTIGRSGDSGESMTPHLHFDVTKGATDRRNAQTIPFFFKNVSPPHRELQMGITYTALPF